MYNVAIILNNTNANISLSFKTREGAEGALKKYEEAIVHSLLVFEDDFGHRALVYLQFIAYVLFIDVEQDQIGRFEHDLDMRRTEKKLIMRLNDSPEERALFPAESSPNNGAQNNRPPRIIQ